MFHTLTSSFIITPWYSRYSVSMINVMPIYTRVYQCCKTRTDTSHSYRWRVKNALNWNLQWNVQCSRIALLAADVAKQRWPGFCGQNWVQQGTLTRNLGATILIENCGFLIVFCGSDWKLMVFRKLSTLRSSTVTGALAVICGMRATSYQESGWKRFQIRKIVKCTCCTSKACNYL